MTRRKKNLRRKVLLLLLNNHSRLSTAAGRFCNFWKRYKKKKEKQSYAHILIWYRKE
jgi:hypothetical protein